jgi:hypothetical protein
VRPYLDLHDDQVIELVTPDSSPHMLAISRVSWLRSTPTVGAVGAVGAVDAVDAVSVPRSAAFPRSRARAGSAVPTDAGDGSYRASRLTGTTSRPAVAVRDAGIWLVGHLAPGLMIRQLAPIASWTPSA